MEIQEEDHLPAKRHLWLLEAKRKEWNKFSSTSPRENNSSNTLILDFQSP
jgi:hypothetical protein